MRIRWRAVLPTITYPAELPVSGQREEIARALRDHQVVIVAGATGSGKTTQLPKICLELGRESIAHTQPRRIAARTIAERISEELGVELGGLVGYQVRFTDKVSESTRIKVMTDGILLNEIHRDRELRRYDTIIIDEAHERSLNVDFLLGYLKRLLPRRPDLKVIVTSATIDPESFAGHFADASGEPAPVIEVSGRTYPVEVRYRPLVAESGAGGGGEDADDEGAAAEDKDVQRGILDALDELERESSGDVLVFLSGESEIRDAEAAVRAHATRRGGAGETEVLPLYGRLSSADQHRVFEPSKVAGLRRRVVLATNVAETSLTVPGIRYVVDAGTARISRYSVRSKVQRLPIEAISQASANQRSGRSGRTSDGIAIRLYSEEDFERRPEYTDPEILRTNLAAVILQMASLGLGRDRGVPVPDAARHPRHPRRPRPAPRARRARRRRDRRRPAAHRVGRQLARLPIEPRFARMVLESKAQGVSREVLAIVAGLTIQDPRERPLERREQADGFHARFVDPTSDFLSLLNLWNHLEEQQRQLSGSAFRRMCKAEFLNYLRVREWQDLYRQLVRLAKPLGLHVAAAGRRAERRRHPPGAARRPALADRAARRREDLERSRRRGRRARIRAQGPTPAGRVPRRPQHAVRDLPRFGAREEATARAHERRARRDEPAVRAHQRRHRPGLGRAARRARSRSASSANRAGSADRARPSPTRRSRCSACRSWRSGASSSAGSTRCSRASSSSGTRSSRRTGTRAGSTAGCSPSCARTAPCAASSARSRSARVVATSSPATRPSSPSTRRRVPADVADTRAFERWWRGEHRRRPDLLTMTRADLLGVEAEEDRGDGFPDRWRQADQTYSLAYRFEPGAEDDGVTVVVPLVLLPRVQPDGFDWQVPGLRDELITAHAPHAAEGAPPAGRARGGVGGEDLRRTARRSRGGRGSRRRSPRSSRRPSAGSRSHPSTRPTSTSNGCRRTCGSRSAPSTTAAATVGSLQGPRRAAARAWPIAPARRWRRR